MSEYSIYVVCFFSGVASLAFLVAWSSSSSRRTNTAGTEIEKEGFTFCAELPPDTMVGNRIFETTDWLFIRECASEVTQRAFLQDRQEMAIEWLHRSAAHVSYTMREHRRTAGTHDSISASQELRLAVGYAFFMLKCWLMLSMVRLRGPFFAKRVLDLCSQKVEQFDSFSAMSALKVRAVAFGRADSHS